MLNGRVSRFAGAQVTPRLRSISQPIFAAVLGIALGLVVAAISGESPLVVLRILGKSSFGSPYDIGMSLFYATPLIFTGLAVAIPFHAGMFNIGGEGQMTVGICAASAVGILVPQFPSFVAIPLSLMTAVLVGGLWGALPGWMKARRGAHEVIATIMLNFIASALTSWVTLGFLRNTETMNPETHSVGAGYLWGTLPGFGGSPLSAALILGLVVALIVHVVLWRTPLGFEVRAVGHSEQAANFSGIDVGKTRIIAMALGGGMAGLAAVGEVFGNAGKFKLGFSADYGFTGIAVALLGRARPAGIVAAAILFGALHKGASDLDFETDHITRDLSLIMQSFVIIAVAADGLWTWRRQRKGTP